MWGSMKQSILQFKETKPTIWASSVLSSSLNLIPHFNYFEIIWVRVPELTVNHYTMEKTEQNYLNRLLRWQSKQSNKSQLFIFFLFFLFLNKYQKQLCFRTTLSSQLGYKVKNDDLFVSGGVHGWLLKINTKRGRCDAMPHSRGTRRTVWELGMVTFL